MDILRYQKNVLWQYSKRRIKNDTQQHRRIKQKTVLALVIFLTPQA